MTNGLEAGRVVWLIVRSDEPDQGDFSTSERRAALKVAWLKRQGIDAKIVRAVVEPGETP